MNPFAWLFDSSGYMPHGACYLWKPTTLWLNVGGDVLTGLSYMAIPAILYYFVRKRRRDLPFRWIALLFAAFIFLCGGTHFFEIWTVWNPDYQVQGLLKVLTGVVSMATAVALLWIMPVAMRFRTPLQTAAEIELQTATFSAANTQLRQEIASREEFERRLIATEQRYRLATQALQGFIYDHDTAQGTLEVRGGFNAVVGFPAADMPHDLNWWVSRIYPLDIEAVHRAKQQAYRSGADFCHCEYRVRHSDGQYVWVSDHSTLVRNAAGEVLREVGNVIGIADRKEAEAERTMLLKRERAARAEAEAANRSKDDFLAVLSHELRTPLSTIGSWAHVLKARAADPAQVVNGAEIIERNTKLLGKLIGDLFDLNRIAAGKLALAMERVDLRSVVTAAIETVRPAADAKRIHIDYVAVDLPGPLLADPTRLHQILGNLLSNAVKFTPSEGSIRVRSGVSGTRAQIVVSDTGQGIDPRVLPDIFERFRQADGPVTTGQEGLGLGLAIVKELVQMHGGTVRAESAGENRGSTFTVELPLSSAGTLPTPHPADAQSEETILAGAVVLVVDDQADSAEGTARLLRCAGARVVTACSAAAALQSLAIATVHLVLTDIGMPDGDGYQLLRGAREAGHRQPFIALTAFARAEDQARAVAAGFARHITKPADAAELVQAVAEVYRFRRRID